MARALQGKTFWIELDQEDFGLLQREFRGSPLIDPILERFKALKENLDIILWAEDHCTKDEMRRGPGDPRGTRRE